ncbi:hypothetical protein SBV1_580010 [Verrucomicrobia bacterium]|nr:hypothetical protein SBV1_580010 [Verrucomicrobiota bacterium]
MFLVNGMLETITPAGQKGQLIGTIIGVVVSIGFAVYLMWILPARVRRDVANGKLSEDQAVGKLKKCRIGAYGFWLLATYEVVQFLWR